MRHTPASMLRRATLTLAILALVPAAIIAFPRPAWAARPVPPAGVTRATSLAGVASAVVRLARSLVGSPYAYIGDDPDTGFSCIGFVHYLYARVGIDVPYDLELAYAAGPHLAVAALQPGDLVFFRDTVWKGLSHVALYAGDGEVIGADNVATGVEVTRLSDPYWAAHYLGATRPLGLMATVPVRAILPLPALPVRSGQLLRGGVAGEVYSGPGYAYLRVDRLAPRMGLRVVSVQGRWAQVVYRGAGSDYYGWVDAAYLAACTSTTRPRLR